MNLALTPKETTNIKSKGVDITDFQKWRRILKVQLKRLNHKQTL